MDRHLCLSAPNVDLVLARLLRDGKNIVTRSSYSFYVEVPFGLTFQVLGTSNEARLVRALQLLSLYLLSSTDDACSAASAQTIAIAASCHS